MSKTIIALEKHSDTHGMTPCLLKLENDLNFEALLNRDFFTHWLACAEEDDDRKLSSQSQASSRLLNRFGMKNAQDIFSFFRTPSGEIVRKMLNRQLADLMLLRNMRDQLTLNQQLRKHRMLAFLLLSLCHRHKSNLKHRLKLLHLTPPDLSLHHLAHLNHEEALEQYLNTFKTSLSVVAQLFNEKLQETETIDPDTLEEPVLNLTPDQKIIKDGDGFYYLISSRSNHLPEFHKAAARLKFDCLKHEIKSLKNPSAKAEHPHPSELILLQNQLAHIQSSLSLVQTEMNKRNPDPVRAMRLQASQPNASARVSVNKTLFTPQSFQRVFRQMLSQPSQANIQTFRTQLTNIYGQNGQGIGLLLGKILPGRRIPVETMKYLIKSVRLLTFPMDKPRHNPEEIHTMPHYKSPTPFGLYPKK